MGQTPSCATPRKVGGIDKLPYPFGSNQMPDRISLIDMPNQNIFLDFQVVFFVVFSFSYIKNSCLTERIFYVKVVLFLYKKGNIVKYNKRMFGFGLFYVLLGFHLLLYEVNTHKQEKALLSLLGFVIGPYYIANSFSTEEK
jgi:hypothetical protein